ncbi:hypothetical protein H2248_000602 [Termitomyces sp. 'cryptogamus']|nr:hypothetical protein H2248_000602 [Termitomyces sp. 'cryptogamus']
MSSGGYEVTRSQGPGFLKKPRIWYSPNPKRKTQKYDIKSTTRREALGKREGENKMQISVSVADAAFFQELDRSM